jgi:acetyl-CoA C-acetyltransferase
LVAQRLGLGPIPCTKMEGACASGSIAFSHAYLLIAAGVYDTVLVVGVEKMSHAGTAKVTEALNCAMDMAHDGVSGLSYPGVFGLLARLYDARYGGARAGMSAVAIKNKRNGLANPLAQMGRILRADRHRRRRSRRSAEPIAADQRRRGRSRVLTTAERVRGRHDHRDLVATQAVVFVRTAGPSDLCTFGARPWRWRGRSADVFARSVSPS